jgi:hypothetical protein
MSLGPWLHPLIAEVLRETPVLSSSHVNSWQETAETSADPGWRQKWFLIPPTPQPCPRSPVDQGGRVQEIPRLPQARPAVQVPSYSPLFATATYSLINFLFPLEAAILLKEVQRVSMLGQAGAQRWEAGNICLLGPEAGLGRQSYPQWDHKDQLMSLVSKVPWDFCQWASERLA